MEFTLYLKNNPYPEYYNVPECKTPEDCERYARKIIARFNANLRPNESPREFDRVAIESKPDGPAIIPHLWKKTNVATVVGKGTAHDTYRCERCGITGKRVGFDPVIHPDPKYRGLKFSSCGLAAISSTKSTKPIKSKKSK